MSILEKVDALLSRDGACDDSPLFDLYPELRRVVEAAEKWHGDTLRLRHCALCEALYALQIRVSAVCGGAGT